MHNGKDLNRVSGSKPSRLGINLSRMLLPDEAVKLYRISPGKQRKNGRPDYPDEYKENLILMRRKFKLPCYFHLSFFITLLCQIVRLGSNWQCTTNTTLKGTIKVEMSAHFDPNRVDLYRPICIDHNCLSYIILFFFVKTVFVQSRLLARMKVSRCFGLMCFMSSLQVF